MPGYEPSGSMRTYCTSVRQIAARARAFFGRASAPWSVECDQLLQDIPLVQPGARPVDESQCDSFVTRYGYVGELVARLAAGIQDYGRDPTRAKQQALARACSTLVQEVEDALALLNALERRSVARQGADAGMVPPAGQGSRELTGLAPRSGEQPEGLPERDNRLPLLLYLLTARADERWRQALEQHLASFVARYPVRLWHSQMVSAGQETGWAREDHLRQAALVVVLISAECLRSCAAEITVLREQYASTSVIPILLRSVDLQDTPLAGLQCLPRSGIPVTRCPDKDEALREAVSDIRQQVLALLEGQTGEER